MYEELLLQDKDFGSREFRWPEKPSASADDLTACLCLQGWRLHLFRQPVLFDYIEKVFPDI